MPYLSEDAIFGPLDALAQALAPDSELVFDFGGPLDERSPRDAAALEKLRRFTARRGEPLRTYGPVEPFLARACAHGFEVAERLSPRDQQQRYLDHIPGGLRTLPGAYLVRLRRVRRGRTNLTGARPRSPRIALGRGPRPDRPGR